MGRFRAIAWMAGTGAALLLTMLSGCAAPAPSPSAEAPQPTLPATTDSGAPVGYRLGEGDMISIKVFDEPDLSIDARVGASGIINYSYLGDLQVAGKTPQQVERQITTQLTDGYLVNPSVNVAITEYRPFFINGEVQSPGSYPYQPGLTLNKAIALAGGLTERASTRRISIIRADAGNNASAEKARMSSPISPGDIISIKEGFF